MPSFRAVGAIATLLAASTLVSLTGCDTAAGKADKQVREDINAALPHINGTLDDRKDAEAKLNTAWNETSASPISRANVQELRALLEIRNAQDLQTKINSTQAEVNRLVWEIRQLGAQIQASNQLAAALSGYDPTEVVAKLQTSISDVQGAADKPVWIKTDNGGIPSLAAVNANITALQSQITELQNTMKTVGDQRNDQLAQADKLTQQSEKAKGAAAVDLYKEAAEAKKKSEEMGVQIDDANLKLARAQTDLDVAQGQATVLNTALKDVGNKADQTASVWKTIQEQIENQRAQAKALAGDPSQTTLNPSDPTGGSTVISKSAMLEDKLKLLRGLREEGENHVNSAVDFFKDAGQIAMTLQTSLQTQMSDPKSTNSVNMTAWRDESAAMHPARYALQQANALDKRAMLALARANDAAQIQQLGAYLKPILQPTAVALPTVLQDSDNKLASDVKTGRQLADLSYAAAIEILDNVSGGSGSEDQHHAARVATIFTQYGWYLLGSSVGDKDAASHLERAKEVVKDTEQLPALPPELAVAPAPAAPAAH